jgi:alkylated DNA nucleotide flippase Atl1
MKQKAGEFSKKVIELALTIPPSRVTTYGLITAAAGGHPMMSRMITHILGKSSQVDQIPFHRIVYSSGKIWLGRQSFSDGGDYIKFNKNRLLQYKKEGIKIDKNNKIVDFEKIVYTF